MANPSHDVLADVAAPEDGEDEDGTEPAGIPRPPERTVGDWPTPAFGQSARLGGRARLFPGLGGLGARAAAGVQRLLGPGNRTRILGVGTALTILGALLAGFLADAAVIGKLRHDRDRQVAYASLRYNLANGTTPTGALDAYVEQVATLGAAVEAPRFADRLLLLGDPRITERIDHDPFAVRLELDSGPSQPPAAHRVLLRLVDSDSERSYAN